MGEVNTPKRRARKIPARRQRMYFIIFSGICVALAAFVVLTSLRDNITLFRTPTDLITKPVKIGDQIRIGGLVKEGTFKQNQDGGYEFTVTDTENELKIKYYGMLPSLFREKQGVVISGAMDVGGSFKATQILAKHDEKYMPPEVTEALKQKGYYRK